jgi:hypothetical protein
MDAASCSEQSIFIMWLDPRATVPMGVDNYRAGGMQLLPYRNGKSDLRERVMRIVAGISAIAVAMFAGFGLAQTPMPGGKHCVSLVGDTKAPLSSNEWAPTPGPTRGSILLVFSVDQHAVQIYWLRDRAPFDVMAHGGDFDTITKTMSNQGVQFVTSSQNGLTFFNGFDSPENKQTYFVTISGDSITGKAVSGRGQFSLRGTCK